MTSKFDTTGFRLPHAARALDSDAIGAELRATLFANGPSVRAVRPCYLRLKPATALFVLWEVDLDVDADVGLRHEYVELSTGNGTLLRQEQRKWETLHPSLLPRERYLAFDAAHDTILARLPFDLELRRLPRLLDPEGIKWVVETLDAPFGDGRSVAIRARGSSGTLLSFRPRRRAVVRLDLRGRDGEETVARHAIAREFAAPPISGLAWRRALEPGAWPRLLSASGDATLLLETLLSGAPWSGAAPSERVPFPCAAVGALVGRFHAATQRVLEPFTTPPRSWSQELEAARAVVVDIAALAPALAAAAQSSLRAVATWSPREGELVGVHGDLHAGQFLFDADGHVALCDLDRAAPGSRAKDLGRLVADLERHSALPHGGVAALLDGYAQGSGVSLDAEALLPWIALAHLQAASEPLRRCLADAAATTARQLERAAQLGRDASRAEATS